LLCQDESYHLEPSFNGANHPSAYETSLPPSLACETAALPSLAPGMFNAGANWPNTLSLSIGNYDSGSIISARSLSPCPESFFNCFENVPGQILQRGGTPFRLPQSSLDKTIVWTDFDNLSPYVTNPSSSNTSELYEPAELTDVVILASQLAQSTSAIPLKTVESLDQPAMFSSPASSNLSSLSDKPSVPTPLPPQLKGVRIERITPRLVCPQCSEAFSRKQDLRRHTLRNHFSCDICDETFQWRKTRDNHKKREHLKISHQCSMCTYSTAQSSNLARHKKNKHKTVQFG